MTQARRSRQRGGHSKDLVTQGETSSGKSHETKNRAGPGPGNVWFCATDRYWRMDWRERSNSSNDRQEAVPIAGEKWEKMKSWTWAGEGLIGELSGSDTSWVWGCVGVRSERGEEGRVRDASQISSRGDGVNDGANWWKWRENESYAYQGRRGLESNHLFPLSKFLGILSSEKSWFRTVVVMPFSHPPSQSKTPFIFTTTIQGKQEKWTTIL